MRPRRRSPHGRLRALAAAALLLGACGGAPAFAPMPDVARTDRSADELGLPSEQDEPSLDDASDTPTGDGEADAQAPSAGEPSAGEPSASE